MRPVEPTASRRAVSIRVVHVPQDIAEQLEVVTAQIAVLYEAGDQLSGAVSIGPVELRTSGLPAQPKD